ncbi:MAG: dihydrolipoyl dehydrogenase [Phycisphaerae bacterium]|nr:dihydrolipoyl dehydrogenase [Phycisphaerae bacterium]
MGELTEETQVLVIGGGPGGYVAAFRAADLGLETTIVEESPLLGGICLREGCIPSKALLHIAHLIEDAAEAEQFGVKFNTPKIDRAKVAAWKQSVVDKLCGGIKTLASKRKVRVIQGRASFEDSRTVRIEGGEVARLKFKHAIVATGSRPSVLPESVLPADCYMDSTGALALETIPKTLLVVGGGYIGLELGQVYAGLGSKVTVIEMLDHLLPGCDADLSRTLTANLKKQFAAIHTSAKLDSGKKVKDGVEITYTKGGKQTSEVFERVLVSVGRRPASDTVAIENTKAKVTERGFIEINERCQTADKHIYAIGDVAGNPMLAHKASREGIVAAENIAGHDSAFDNRAIPAVVYTSPEIAWCGLTEEQAKEKGIEIKVGKFNWGASGRAVAMGRPAGLTKVISDAQGQRVLGVGIVGEHAGDLIAEAVLAIEMGAEVEDLAMTIHPHPATSETVMEAAESILGSATHALKR